MNDQWIGWLQERQRHFFYGILLVVASMFIAFQVFQRMQKTPSQDFFSAHQTFEKWVMQGEAFEKLEEALQEHPELEAKFGALIADRFIVENEGKKAEPFADRVLKRVSSNSPEYASFSETSLLIAQGELNQALKKAISLQESLEPNSLLCGFNLLRMASLYRALALSDQEMACIGNLQAFMQENKRAGGILQHCFSEADARLSDYLQSRKIVLEERSVDSNR